MRNQPLTGHVMCLWLGAREVGEPRWFEPMPWLWDQHSPWGWWGVVALGETIRRFVARQAMRRAA